VTTLTLTRDGHALKMKARIRMIVVAFFELLKKNEKNA
jgi:hypothetical protein